MSDKINYTIINHTAREALGLTWVEYGLIDLVHNLSNNPTSSGRWCYASKETLAKILCITPRYVYEIISRGVEKGLLEKHPETKHLRTTQLWFDSVIIKKETGHPEQSSQPMNKVHTTPEQSSVSDTEQSSHNNDKSYKDNNNESIPADKPQAHANGVKVHERKPSDKQTQLQRICYVLEDTLQTRIVNWGKQAKALDMMLKAGYNEKQILFTIRYMAKDEFYEDKGFELMTVANNIARVKATVGKAVKRSE